MSPPENAAVRQNRSAEACSKPLGDPARRINRTRSVALPHCSRKARPPRRRRDPEVAASTPGIPLPSESPSLTAFRKLMPASQGCKRACRRPHSQRDQPTRRSFESRSLHRSACGSSGFYFGATFTPQSGGSGFHHAIPLPPCGKLCQEGRVCANELCYTSQKTYREKVICIFTLFDLLY